jgi:Tol biopolymer transport system component
VLKQIDLPHHYYYREMYLPQLTSGPSSEAWMPDGQSVVYSMQGWLWRQALDSTRAEQISSGPGYHYQPDVSPDGRWVVYVVYANDAMELHALELASGRAVQLTRGGAVNTEPRFSPDGRRLAFVSTEFNGRFHIFVGDFRDGALANVARITGETSSITDRYYYSRFDTEISPAWSPDGREIIFVSNRQHRYGSGGLWRMRVDDCRGALVCGPYLDAREIHREETTWKARPDWSPDGRRVVWSSYAGRQWNQLALTPAEAGGYSFPLTYGQYDNTAPRWSPDGRRVAFISNRGGNTSLWIVDVPGGAQRQLIAKQRQYQGQTRTLRLRVLDAAGRPTAARVSVTDEGGRFYAPDDAWVHGDEAFDRRERPFEAHYFHTRGVAELQIGLGAVDVEVMKGFQYGVHRQRVETDSSSAGGRPVTLTVRLPSLAFAPSPAETWLSGDTHVHMNYGGAYRATPETLLRQAEAEDLGVVNNLIVNKEVRIPDVAYFTGKLEAASTPGTLIWHGQEFHTSSWDHIGLLGLRSHMILPDYSDYPQTAAASLYPSNDVVSDLARAQGGIVGYVHPFDVPAPDPFRDARVTNALPIDAALGKVDFLEVVGFSDHHISADIWYRLLNCGFRIAAGGGTDAMANFASLRGPLGTARVFVRLPRKLMTKEEKMEAWFAGLKRGQSFATSGPLLRFTLGGQGIGGEVRLAAGRQEVAFRAAVRSLVPLDHAEIVCNGRVVQSLALTAGTTADASGKIALEKSGWCILRAWNEKAQHPVLDRYPYATTSPIYITVGGAPARSREDAAFFLAWIDKVRQFAEAHAGWNTPAERAHALQQIAAARAIYEEQMQ